jgi:hypothetical protein
LPGREAYNGLAKVSTDAGITIVNTIVAAMKGPSRRPG